MARGDTMRRGGLQTAGDRVPAFLGVGIALCGLLAVALLSLDVFSVLLLLVPAGYLFGATSREMVDVMHDRGPRDRTSRVPPLG